MSGPITDAIDVRLYIYINVDRTTLVPAQRFHVSFTNKNKGGE